ncbi:MAG TPA: asparagine synthase (glutamine-hydrolyzing), partial [Lachnospiraceae bacterium]|nr:asparagine synthase (glutamine-hydrolyzing) [Lachnospiraceae bacterium]
GEIYNYQELRQQLLEAGHSFSTQGDSEVLLHGYEEWGERLPEHLRGMFAFAIWDEKNERLYAARDPFGIKPFYYTLADGCFIFASEIKGILPHPSYKKKLNTEALEQYLSFQYSALEQTFFQGIRQLKPGHFLKYDRKTSSLELTQYFVPELYPGCSEKQKEKTGENPEKTDMERWVSLLDQVIGASVKTHMAADVEVGAFLSGGVDSSLVAAEFTGTKTFTVGFGKSQTRYNEMPLAKELAEELNLSHKGKQISEREFWEAVPEVLYHMDEPSGDPSAVALYFVSREAARKVKVVVSGEGADELFGGYCIYCEPNALRLYQKLPSLLRKGIAGLATHLPNMRGRSFLIRGSMPVEERFIGNANLFTAKERKRLLKIKTKALSPQEFLSNDYEDARALDDASRMQYIDLLHWLPGDILQKADRMSMAHSLELRVPYLDREVFEVARCLPANYKQKKQVSKYLFRQVAARHLPAASSSRRKLGFPVPLGHFLTSETGSEAILRAFHSPAAEKFFNREALDELMAGRGFGRGNTNRKLWAVYAFLVWYEIYFPEEASR